MRLPLALLFSTLLLPAPVSADAKCAPGEHWVRAHFRRAYVRSDGVAVSASNVIAHCADNPSGFEFWSPKFKSGRPSGWKSATEQESQWSDAERERVLEELSRLPKILRLESLTGLHRMKRSKDFPNPMSNNGDAIVIYDNAFTSKQILGRGLAHELAHVIFEHLPGPEQDNYAYAAGWAYGGDGIWDPRFNEFVEPDGETSRGEDFANNVEYFLFNPAKLKTTRRGAYNWIARHFGDTFKLGKGSSRD